MTTTTTEPTHKATISSLYARNARSVVARGLKATKSTNWVIVLSGFFEPVFFLLAMGLGLGTFIGDVELPNGTSVSYAAYPPVGAGFNAKNLSLSAVGDSYEPG